jgi:pimeloyl-ACP methyl ester carboxylesterase
MIAAGLGGRGASQHRGRSAFYDQQLEAAMYRLLHLGGASCQRNFSALEQRRLHYLEAGAGRPLLLLHGAGGGAANWYRLFASLSTRWRVLAPDLPGFGFSDPVEPAAPLGQQVAAFLAEWLRSIGVDRAHVIGTSFGGLVALRLDRHIAIPRLAVIDSVGLDARMPLLLRLATLPVIARLVVAPTRRGTRAMFRHALTSARLPAEHEQALIDYLYWSAKSNDARTMARAFTRFAGISGQRDVVTVDQLRNIAERLLLIWGERDDFLPVAHVRRVCALAGCSDVRIIPGAGHSPNWEQPERLLNVINEFLENE